MSLGFICGQPMKKFAFKRVGNRISVSNIGSYNQQIKGGFRQLG
jgi:hypothetical protein